MKFTLLILTSLSNSTRKHLDLRLQKKQKLPTEASSWYSWVMIPPRTN